MRPKYDYLLLGLLLGLLLPALAFFVVQAANGWLAAGLQKDFTFKERTVALIAVCCNLLPLGYFRRRFYNAALRGLVMTTMMLALCWFFYYGRSIGS
ncbi:MAG: hypothetical protein HC821_02590 [Lewinella sp.]|nr:hypothetical protein [Lewinella sp.]